MLNKKDSLRKSIEKSVCVNGTWWLKSLCRPLHLLYISVHVIFSFGMWESLSHQQMWYWARLCVLPDVTPWLIFKTYSDRDKALCSTVYTSHLNCSLSLRLSISLQYVCWMVLSVVEGNDFSRLSEEWLKWFYFFYFILFFALIDKLAVLGAPRVCQLEIISDWGGGRSEVRLMFDVEGSLMVM